MPTQSRSKSKNGKKKKKPLKKAKNYLSENWVGICSGALMIIGIILAFFYLHIGGALVGLGVGLCFFDELLRYFTLLRSYYSVEGVFKTLMFVGLALYLFIAAPIFLLAIAVGFGVMLLIRRPTR